MKVPEASHCLHSFRSQGGAHIVSELDFYRSYSVTSQNLRFKSISYGHLGARRNESRCPRRRIEVPAATNRGARRDESRCLKGSTGFEGALRDVTSYPQKCPSRRIEVPVATNRGA